jgi:hypothetical protein
MILPLALHRKEAVRKKEEEKEIREEESKQITKKSKQMMSRRRQLHRRPTTKPILNLTLKPIMLNKLQLPKLHLVP